MNTNPSPPNPPEDRGTLHPHDDFDPSKWILSIAGVLFVAGLIWMFFVIVRRPVVTPARNFPALNSVNR